MKNFILFLLISSFSFGQTIQYDKPLKKGNYSRYISKDGTIVKIGDTLHINQPNGYNYVYIYQGGAPGGTVLANKDIVITKIKVVGFKGHKPIVAVGFKGYGLLTLLIDYENALEAGEIYNPNGQINRAEALAILKDKKELLDLELITKEEYDKIKKELTPIIMGK